VDAKDCSLDALGEVSNPRPGSGCEHQDREGTFLGNLLISHHHCGGGGPPEFVGRRHLMAWKITTKLNGIAWHLQKANGMARLKTETAYSSN